MSELETIDPQIAESIRLEEERQLQRLELIASENFASPAVRQAQASVLTNKYAEGYPGHRYYGGCEFVDVGGGAEPGPCVQRLQLVSERHVLERNRAGPQRRFANLRLDQRRVGAEKLDQPLLLGVERIAADRESAEIAAPIYAYFRELLADRGENAAALPHYDQALKHYPDYVGPPPVDDPRRFGVAVVDQQGNVVGSGAGIGRKFLHIIDSMICGLGYLLPLVDAKRQTIADKIMTTYVVTGIEKKPFSVSLWAPPQN